MTTVIPTRPYLKQIVKLLRGDERARMETAIAANPEASPIISGTNGVRKARWGRPGSGKSGGIRVVYYWHVTPGVVYMLAAYAKNEKENLSESDKKALRKIVRALPR